MAWATRHARHAWLVGSTPTSCLLMSQQLMRNCSAALTASYLSSSVDAWYSHQPLKTPTHFLLKCPAYSSPRSLLLADATADAQSAMTDAQTLTTPTHAMGLAASLPQMTLPPVPLALSQAALPATAQPPLDQAQAAPPLAAQMPAAQPLAALPLRQQFGGSFWTKYSRESSSLCKMPGTLEEPPSQDRANGGHPMVLPPVT
jgi:hypothetical protein